MGFLWLDKAVPGSTCAVDHTLDACCPLRLLSRTSISRFDAGRENAPIDRHAPAQQDINGLEAVQSTGCTVVDTIRRESAMVLCRPTYMQVFGS